MIRKEAHTRGDFAAKLEEMIELLIRQADFLEAHALENLKTAMKPLEPLLEKAFDAGFSVSAEGWNAEHPFQLKSDFNDISEYRKDKQFIENLEV